MEGELLSKACTTFFQLNTLCIHLLLKYFKVVFPSGICIKLDPCHADTNGNTSNKKVICNQIKKEDINADVIPWNL